MKVTFCTWCGVTTGNQNECFANKHYWYTSNSPYCSWCGMTPGSTPRHCTANKHNWQESPRDNSNSDNSDDIVAASAVKGTLSFLGLGLLGLGIGAGLKAISDKNDNNERLETNATILAVYRLQQTNILTFDFLVQNLCGKDKLFEDANKAIIYISKLIVDGILINPKNGDKNTLQLNPENEIVKIISNDE